MKQRIFRVNKRLLPSRDNRRFRTIGSLALSVTFSLYILFSVPVQAAEQTADPFESVNRVTHEFNQAVDKVMFKPAARSYQRWIPLPVKSGIRNFFGNLDDVRVLANNLLQFDLTAAARSSGRLLLNTSLGLGGLLDVAGNEFDLGKQNQDFGMTLARYGVGSGPYMVLPFLGPSTLRDAAGSSVDTVFDPVLAIDEVTTRNSLLGVEAASIRAQYLGFDTMVFGDDYLFYREAYLQNREYAIHGQSMEVSFQEF